MTALEALQRSLPPVVGASIFLYIIGGAIYRLYFSPIAKFPGPKLAALTLWYEFYYDVVKRGRYTFEIAEMHKKYGPIIRINPYELHIDDPEYYLILNSGGSKKRDKYSWATRVFGFTEAAIATVDHDRHRIRRRAMDRLFSKEGIRRLEPIMQAALEKLLSRLHDFQESGKPLNIILAYSAFTSDVIHEYAFAKQPNWLEAPDFNAKFFQMMVTVHETGAIAKQFAWFMPLMDSLPDWFVSRFDEGMKLWCEFRRGMKAQITEVIRNSEHYEKVSHPTVFHEILNSDMPDDEKSAERLWQEAQTFCVAGTETTAWTLSVITFYLLSYPNTFRKLKEELQTAQPDLSSPVPLKNLEQLPYLTAVIQEGLRTSFGVSTRLQRVCPDETLKYSDGETTWEIPPGTPVGMSGPLIHLNPSIFPSPFEFRPERWIENPRLDRYLCSFSKGSRQCLGMNMAYAEMYLCLAGLFRRYGGAGETGPSGELQLYETTIEDVEYQHDLFVPFPKTGTNGVRVVVK